MPDDSPKADGGDELDRESGASSMRRGTPTSCSATMASS
jgi:hypothetical protein